GELLSYPLQAPNGLSYQADAIEKTLQEEEERRQLLAFEATREWVSEQETSNHLFGRKDLKADFLAIRTVYNALIRVIDTTFVRCSNALNPQEMRNIQKTVRYLHQVKIEKYGQLFTKSTNALPGWCLKNLNHDQSTSSQLQDNNWNEAIRLKKQYEY